MLLPLFLIKNPEKIEFSHWLFWETERLFRKQLIGSLKMITSSILTTLRMLDFDSHHYIVHFQINMTHQKYQLHRSNGELVEMTLSDIIAQNERTLLYFYPKDNTPGCTKEAMDFTRLKQDFWKLWIQIIGVSRDSIASHGKFTISCALWIDLISDSDEVLHNQFWVIGEKKNYGKVSIGVIRSTFLLDNHGNIVQEWRNVKATGHAEKVLREVTTL